MIHATYIMENQGKLEMFLSSNEHRCLGTSCSLQYLCMSSELQASFSRTGTALRRTNRRFLCFLST